MKIQSLFVSIALWIPLTFSGPQNPVRMDRTAAAQAAIVELDTDPVFSYLLPGDPFSAPVPAGRGPAVQRSGLLKLNGDPSPALPLPDLDASVQLVVGPVGAPSQGTIVRLPGEGFAIITHDHFQSPALDERDDLFVKEHGEAVFTGRIDIAARKPDASRFEEVNIIPMGSDFAPSAGSWAPVASPAAIGQIRVGDWVQVVYNAGTRAGEFDLRVVSLQVTRIDATTLQVYDPDRLINKGDSGGAVYFDGELIGVLWSIGEYGFGPAANVSLLR